MDKITVRNILQDALVYIRKYALSDNAVEYIQEINSLADMVHNAPTLLLDWDDLKKNEPKKLVFLIQSFQSNIDVFTQKFPHSILSKSLLKNIYN